MENQILCVRPSLPAQTQPNLETTAPSISRAASLPLTAHTRVLLWDFCPFPPALPAHQHNIPATVTHECFSNTNPSPPSCATPKSRGKHGSGQQHWLLTPTGSKTAWKTQMGAAPHLPGSPCTERGCSGVGKAAAAATCGFLLPPSLLSPSRLH